MMEERNPDALLSNGKAFKFSSDDAGWCTNCTVYYLIDISDASYYYVTASSSSRKDTINSQISTYRSLNA
jgi:hypothetical protein